MAVAPASMADKIIVLDDDDEVVNPHPCRVSSNSSSDHQNKNISPIRAQQPAPTHITQSPFASVKKNKTVVAAENQKLFTEFVEHCTPFTQDCPEVLTFLQTKHDKASLDYLSSVEFRNTVGRCLTRAQANRSKIFVYIRELCTVLRQHAAKKRQALTKVEPSTSSCSSQSTSVMPKNLNQAKGKAEVKEEKLAAEEEQSSTSGLQEDNNDEKQETERKAKRASKKQIVYLENLLKLYNDEICRLQRAELSLDDLNAEDSLYIQEHKLKRKMMKIYEKLCDLKGCPTTTGRVIEQRIPYEGTRYPEINKKIERFINSPEAQRNPPDYQDILQQVLRANERHSLCLSRKQLTQVAQEAFRETGALMQDRRQMDLLFNFGSQLTDAYKPATDPALSDPALLRKLRTNRELAVSRLEEVITKYATKQEDVEETERQKRQNKVDKEGNNSAKAEEKKETNGAPAMEEEDDEEDDDEEDESTDPDIEEEIQASTRQDGSDDDEDERDEDNGNEAEQAEGAVNREDQTDGLSGSVSAAEDASVRGEDDAPVSSGLGPVCDRNKSQMSPLSDIPSSRDSPSQSEPMQSDDKRPLSNGNVAEAVAVAESVDSSNQTLESITDVTKGTDVPPVVANGVSAHTPPAVNEMRTTNGTSPPPSPRTTRSYKRKREETPDSRNTRHAIIYDSSEVDITLDMGVLSCNSPQQAESTRADTPTHEMVSSSQSTPPPKKNKVNVATQCDPDAIIVLSDSE